MDKEIGIDIVIEREKVDEKTVFIASSPDINVFAEGETIEEATEKFVEGARSHLETFPGDRIFREVTVSPLSSLECAIQ